MIYLLEGPFSDVTNLVTDTVDQLWNKSKEKKETEDQDKLYRINNLNSLAESNIDKDATKDIENLIKFCIEFDPNYNDNIKAYINMKDEEKPAIDIVLDYEDVATNGWVGIGENEGKEDTPDDSPEYSFGHDEHDLPRKVMKGGYLYNKYLKNINKQDNTITFEFPNDSLKEDSLEKLVKKVKGSQDTTKQHRRRNNNNSQNDNDTQSESDDNNDNDTQSESDDNNDQSTQGETESMASRDKSFSFKDKHICRGCGKPLSQCVCKIDDMEESYDMQNDVETGESFIESGMGFVWNARESDLVYDDFDCWSVWSAYDDDGEEAYFVVEEDTGFIDWGPCFSLDEAMEFLESKGSDDLEEATTFSHPSNEDELDYYKDHKKEFKYDSRREYEKNCVRRKRNVDRIENGIKDDYDEYELDEDLELSEPEDKGETLLISINGTPYEYKLNDNCPFSVAEMTYKVNRMKGFSAGKALQFLKKNMTGTKVQTESKKLGEEIVLEVKLTEIPGTIAHALATHINDIYASKTKDEILKKVSSYFEEEDIDTPYSRKVLRLIPTKRNADDVRKYLLNVMFAGDDLRVNQEGKSKQLASLDLSEDIASGATQPSNVASGKVDAIDLMPDSEEEDEDLSESDKPIDAVDSGKDIVDDDEDKELEECNECLIRVEVSKDDVTTTYASTNLGSVKSTMKLAGVTEKDVTNVEGCEKADLFDQEVQ